MGRGGGGTHVFHINDGIPIPYNFLNSFLSNSANKNNIGLYLAKKLVYIHNECGNTLLKLSVTYEDRTISYQHSLIDQWLIVLQKRAINNWCVTHSIALQKSTQ